MTWQPEKPEVQARGPVQQVAQGEPKECLLQTQVIITRAKVVQLQSQ